jgi:low affinity Fe/Cu permease
VIAGAGARSEEFAESRRRAGLHERTFLQSTPMGDLVIVTLEGEDPRGLVRPDDERERRIHDLVHRARLGCLIALWAASGPFFGFSDTWQLVINTSTTIVTFLLGILILLEANRQAKESKVVHDELIRAVKGARNELINVDEMSEAEVDRLEANLRRRAARSHQGTDIAAPTNPASE